MTYLPDPDPATARAVARKSFSGCFGPRSWKGPDGE